MKRVTLFAALAATAAAFAEQADHWTLALDDGQTLAADATGTITDGEWTLLVRFLGDGSTTAKRTLKLGVATDGNTYGSAYLGYESGTSTPRADGKPGALNLDKPIHYGEQTDWTITQLTTHCLGNGNSSESGNKAHWLTSLRMPKTLTAWGNELAKSNGSVDSLLGEVIVDVPNLTGTLNQYSFYNYTGITNFVLKAPKVTEVSRCFLYCSSGGNLSATDVSTWELPLVTTLGERAFANLRGARGTLRLPKLTEAKFGTSYGVFESSGFESIELGTSATSAIRLDNKPFANCPNLRTVTIGGDVDVKVGTNAFWNCGALTTVRIGTAASPNVWLGNRVFDNCTNVEEVVLGGKTSLYLDYGPFYFGNFGSTIFTPKISRLRFLGVAPTLATNIINGTSMWGSFTSSDGHPQEKQLTVEIPGNDASWTAFLGASALGALTEAESNAYHAAWPTRAIPYGVIPDGFRLPTQTQSNRSPLGLKFKQYIAIGDRTALLLPDSAADSRYGDSIVATYASGGYEADADGTIPHGAPQDTVTITATTTCPNGAFVRWYYGGAITEANQRTNPLTLTFEQAKRVYGAAFQHNWTYDATAKTISDGVWTLNAWVNSAEKHTLALGDEGVGASFRGSAYTGVGEGKLDLSGVIRDAADDSVTWTLAKIGDYSLATANKSAAGVTRSVITEIVFPESLENVGEQIMNKGDNYAATLKTVVLEAPNATAMGGWMFSFQGVRRMVLRLPKIPKIHDTFVGSNHDASVKTIEGGMQNPLDLTDASEWDLSGVTWCSGQRTFSLNCLLKGTLRLPKCAIIGDRGTKAHGFLWNAQALDGVELATTRDELTIAAGAFTNSQFKTLTLGARRTMSVDEGAFVGCTALTNVTFLGKAPGQAVVDEILAGVTVPSDGTKNCTIHASGNLGWMAYAKPAQAGETPPAETTFRGVYVTLAGERKAWMLHQASAWDPKGCMVILK